LSSVSGDPARFQRYQDVRDGILLDRRPLRRGHRRRVGLHARGGQRRLARSALRRSYEARRQVSVSGLWDQIPQFYSVDTKTPYHVRGSPLGLDDATQQRSRTGRADR
jgi:hypothetical protein